MADSPIQVGGAYVENEDHVPNATDMRAQFNTSGTGAHGKIEETSYIFDVDKVKTAQEVAAALDPENVAVPESRVLLPDPIGDNDAAREALLARADKRVEEGVVIGDATPAEAEAELDGDEGTVAAVETERANAASNSTGTRNAGQHDGSVTSDAGDDDTKRAARGRADSQAKTQSKASDKDGDKDKDKDKA